VTIGQVGTFSGVVGAITHSARTAMAVWAKDVNSRSGLACHPVQLYTEDDAGDPARAAAAVQDLINQHHVIALTGSIVTFSVAGFRPAIEAAKLPAVGGDLLAPDWDQSPLMFPQGASADDQLLGAVHAGVLAGHQKLGLVYCVEVAECGHADKLLHEGGAKAAGADFVYDSPISITQSDFTAQCLNARNAGVDLLILGMDGASMVRMAHSCAAIGYRPLLLTGAATYTLENTKDPNLRAFGMISESPVAPWVVDDSPQMRAFHAAMNRYAPDLPPDGECVIAWSSGVLLEDAVSRLGPAEQAGALNSALVVEGLERLHDDSLGGLTTRLTFTPGEPHATSTGCIYLLRLSTDGWTAPQGGTPMCR
jgi:branched-chain amino acid transport system substrate-binding protein